jgi:hypothetical protein
VTGLHMQRRTYVFEPPMGPSGEQLVARAAAAMLPTLQRQQPPMLLRDEVIFLLHTAAVHSLAQLAALTSSEPLVEELRADTEARLRFIRDNRE